MWLPLFFVLLVCSNSCNLTFAAFKSLSISTWPECDGSIWSKGKIHFFQFPFCFKFQKAALIREMHSHKVKMLKLSYLERFNDEWSHNQIKSLSTWQYYGWPSLYMNKNCLNCQQFHAADYINYEGWLCLMTIEHFMAKFNKTSLCLNRNTILI